jgi:glycosyltransferase involved in cell wall biosynthesis
VAFVIGRCPPGLCGIGDYTACLAKALRLVGVEGCLINCGNWGLFHALAASRRLASNFDIVHIEYPSLGFGRKLGPQGLSLLRNCVITLHEISRTTVRRKLALLPFTLRAEHIIFTSSFERGFATRLFPWIEALSSVIPVGSNIAPCQNSYPRSLAEIVYFGLIMPGNGLEQVLDLGALIKAAGLPLTIRVIGGVAPQYVEYFDELRFKSTGLAFVWDRDLSEEEIAERLSRASIAYLPYPDGASERRTTLKAALLSGLSVVTNLGPNIPPELRETVRCCESSRHALEVIRALIESPGELSNMSRKAVEYGQRFSWERIAKQHLQIYDSVLSSKRPLAARQRLGALS